MYHFESIKLTFIMIPELRHKIERASTYSVFFGSGPHYDERSGRLYHIDQIAGDCYYMDTKTPAFGKFHLEPGLSFIIPIKGQENKFIVSQQKKLLTIDWATKEVNCVQLIEPSKPTHLNDGKCDPKGRLWFGTMWFGTLKWTQAPGLFAFGLSALYSLDSASHISLKRDGLSLINGMAWSKDKTKYFVIESIERQVWAYDYDNHTGNISNCKIVLDYHESPEILNSVEVPDGMTIDLHDKLWIASYKGKKVMRIDPETGKILGIIKTPAISTTSLTWGGSDFRTLYVTTAKDEFVTEADAGSIFKVTFEQENIRGSANRPFKFK